MKENKKDIKNNGCEEQTVDTAGERTEQQDSVKAEAETKRDDADGKNDEEGKTVEDTALGNAEGAEEDPLDAAKKEIELLKDKYLRSVAEFDNYRKRTLKEKAELILNGSERPCKHCCLLLTTWSAPLPMPKRRRMQLSLRKVWN